MVFFLCEAFFNEKSSNPLELIIIAQDVAIEFDAHHCVAAGFANASVTVHANAFVNWAFAIHLGKLKEARFTIDPDNNELQNFAATRHAKCILPPLGATGYITHGAVGAMGQSGQLDHKVFKSLGKGLKWMREAADKANMLKQEKINLKGEEDDKKKDRIKDIHLSISNMILMASAVENKIQGDYVE
jgi:hypothetical protein